MKTFVRPIIARPGSGCSKVDYGKPAEDTDAEVGTGETAQGHAALKTVGKSPTPSQEAADVFTDPEYEEAAAEPPCTQSWSWSLGALAAQM